MLGIVTDDSSLLDVSHRSSGAVGGNPLAAWHRPSQCHPPFLEMDQTGLKESKNLSKRHLLQVTAAGHCEDYCRFTPISAKDCHKIVTKRAGKNDA